MIFFKAKFSSMTDEVLFFNLEIMHSRDELFETHVILEIMNYAWIVFLYYISITDYSVRKGRRFVYESANLLLVANFLGHFTVAFSEACLLALARFFSCRYFLCTLPCRPRFEDKLRHNDVSCTSPSRFTSLCDDVYATALCIDISD